MESPVEASLRKLLMALSISFVATVFAVQNWQRAQRTDKGM